MLINKYQQSTYETSVVFQNASLRKASTFRGRVDLFQFTGAQYQLNSDPKNPFPIKAEPPEHRVIEKVESKTITLPAYSLTVIRGGISYLGVCASAHKKYTAPRRANKFQFPT